MSRPTTPTNLKSTSGDGVDLEKTAPADAADLEKSPHTDPADSQNQKSVEGSRDDVVKPDQNKSTEPDAKSSTLKTFLLLVAVFLSMFLVAIDRTIISTAIPSITNDYHSFPDVGWYGSAYLLTCCAFQLLFGKFYTFYSVRGVLIGSILLFEASSALCGAAPNSDSFIVGRAISGIGAAGIFAGTIVSVVYVVPLAKRPRIQGFMGALMGLATVIGPLIGGAFTSNVSWRWCFYINLPFGAVAMVAIFYFMRIPKRETEKLPFTQKMSQLDAPGTVLLVPGVVCLVLALQWGGQTYAWNNGRIVALLTLTGVLLIGFVAVQALLPKTATIPPRILSLKRRSVAAALWSTVTIGASQYIFVYYIPIWFQTVKGVAAVESGIRLLPLMIGQVVASIMGGFINQKVGYYTPLGLLGACLMAIGSGLLTTLQVSSGHDKWIGYQALYGFGMGLCFQTPNLATQTVLPKQDVPMGMALMFFGQLLGGAVFVSVGQNVLDNQLLQKLAGIPGFSRELIVSGGATTLLNGIPADQKAKVLVAYNESLQKVFQIGMILACLTVLGVALMEFKSVKKPPVAANGEAKPEKSEEKKEEEEEEQKA